ncbi:MAG: hypothetical protein INH41_10430 [Myxococcaceae bacterium]|jgi:hypothetical protein|nr:hypothetical protein [Myxococcaceae bacterium]MCA3012800.1 hypothetical protein [Myxococcaceae bacterium]
MRLFVPCIASASLIAAGCAVTPARTDPTPTTPAVAPAPPAPPRLDRLSRLDFNLKAQERFLPFFWRDDANGNGALEPAELALLWGPFQAPRAALVDARGEFTQAFRDAYETMVATPDEAALAAPERARSEVLRLELSQGRPTLVETSLASGTDEDRAIVRHVAEAARVVEVIHGKQLGTFAQWEQLSPSDPLSRAVFHRNQGPFCVAPKTEKDEACSALVPRPARLSGLYPAELQGDPKFCDRLAKEKNAKDLMGHFSVVVADGKGFKAVPYSEFYKPEMEQVATSLEAAAAAITSEGEKAFQAYLRAAATAFRTNDWEPANAAWVAMGPTNSKWYLRIAPDEVYYEPCAWKAGFAVSFARINLDSLAWQQKLEPVKGDMEKALAALAGPPYKARDVKFKLPDFIDIVLNAGDARNPHGATIGQSLPNWGKVAEKGGRTVAMTNLYTDVDSQKALEAQMASLFCPSLMAKASTKPGPAVMSVVLHEAAHNLGPSHEYKVKGKEDDEVFGGPLASTMEELKAQTAALYFSEWLVEKKVITPEEAELAHVRDIAWAFGHVSRGMYGADGKPRNYSQLASIQLGTLTKAGVLSFKAAATAANGTDVGCFEVDFSKWKTAVDALARRVLMAKGKGDKKDAEAMVAAFVDAKDDWAKTREVITERWLRAPKATFVYAVTP